MKALLVIILISVLSFADAQTILSVDDAVKIALKNNYEILVYRNNASIAKNNNRPGNAGMLPEFGLNGKANYSVNNVDQSLLGGTTTNYSGLTTTAFNAGAELSWTLFDGGKMFVTKAKLNDIQALGEIQFREKVLQTQYDVVNAYYDIVRQKQQQNSINEIINYNTALVRIMQVAFNGGSVSKGNLLQAKIDLNVYKEDSINQQYAVEAAFKTLNELLSFDPDTMYNVSDSIPFNYNFDKNELISKLNTANSTILSYQKQVDISKLIMKEYNSLRYPLLDLKAGYYLSSTDNSAGTILKNNNTGPQIGATISVPLYQSGNIKRQVNNAKFNIESAQYNLENIKLQVKTDLLNAIREIENQKKLLDIEKENNLLAKEYLQISIDRLKLGQTTALEVHQAQENYVRSATRLVNFEFSLKIAETKLRQIISTL